MWQKRTIVCYKWFWPYGATLITASICTDLYQFIIFPGLKQSKRFLKTQHPQKIILIMVITLQRPSTSLKNNYKTDTNNNKF